MLSIRSLSKSFKTPDGKIIALKNVSFEVAPGEVLALIGPSGAGKSTALRSLNLLERPDSGEVLFRGQNLLSKNPEELRQVRQKMGMIFQHFHLLANKTVEDNVALSLEIAGWDTDKIKKRVAEVLDIVQLSEKAKTYPAKLSGGQKQRVAIARGIANHPDLLLADEPTSALDPLTKLEVLNCLEKLNKEMGLTVVIATHEMNVVKRICSRALLFKDHEVLEEMIPHGGQIHPQTSFGKLFLEAP